MISLKDIQEDTGTSRTKWLITFHEELEKTIYKASKNGKSSVIYEFDEEWPSDIKPLFVESMKELVEPFKKEGFKVREMPLKYQIGISW